MFRWGEHLLRFLTISNSSTPAGADHREKLMFASSVPTDQGVLAPAEPGKDSPYRNRSVEENLELFERMKNGEFEEGSHVLRAKIDMSSPNVVMRDPVIYRIKKVPHHRTGDKWCIYPMYDFTHCLSDAIEGITHSICTLEFENNRPLYEWILEQVFPKPHPQQIEFARLNLSCTMMSKRKLLQLVQQGIVSGWDDPRMPTLAGLRRRGFTPAAIRDFCERIGVAKANSVVDYSLLEHCLREDLNNTACTMAVLRPLKVVIENYPEGQIEYLEAVNNPNDPQRAPLGSLRPRDLHRTGRFHARSAQGLLPLGTRCEVRLRFAYFIKCTDVVYGADGSVVELRPCTTPRLKVVLLRTDARSRATLHWVAAEHSLPAEVRLYDQLFTKEDPNEGDFMENLNPNSLEVVQDARVELNMREVRPGDKFQFERLGYFCVDLDSTPDRLVFNRTVSLKDSWAKMQKK